MGYSGLRTTSSTAEQVGVLKLPRMPVEKKAFGGVKVLKMLMLGHRMW